MKVHILFLSFCMLLPINSVHATTEVSTDSEEVLALSSSCTVPEAPELTIEEHVVGDGTAGSCTNEAIQEAASAGGKITFNCGSEPIVIPITTTLQVEADSIIDGGGLVTLDGLDATRILWASNYIQLELRGLTFTRGSALGAEPLASGGAVRGGWGGSLYIQDCVFTYNEAGVIGKEGGGGVSAPSHTTTTIVGCRFEDNIAGTGAAVHSILSGLTIVDSVFVNNESTTDGGGAVYTDGASEATGDEIGGIISLCGSRFTSNVATFQGGAAYLWTYYLDTVEITQCVFESNSVNFSDADQALGGAVRIGGDTTLYLDQSLFVDNHSASKGGALWVNGDNPSYITNSTFVRNNAGTASITTGGRGGAITGSNLEMVNLTFDSNWAVNGAGAIFNNDDNVVLRNSILLNNYAGNGDGTGNVQVCKEPMQGSNNLQWPEPTSGAPCSEDSIFADPFLVDLDDNGGPSQTEALDTTSPAIDQGADCPDIDQRGESRSEPCDLGAYESSSNISGQLVPLLFLLLSGDE